MCNSQRAWIPTLAPSTVNPLTNVIRLPCPLLHHALLPDSNRRPPDVVPASQVPNFLAANLWLNDQIAPIGSYKDRQRTAPTRPLRNNAWSQYVMQWTWKWTRTIAVDHGYFDVVRKSLCTKYFLVFICWHLIKDAIARREYRCRGLTGCGASDMRIVGEDFDAQSPAETWLMVW